MRLSGGKRRHFVTIEAPVQTKSGTGGVTIAWQTYTQLWASIETLRPFEKNSANASWPGAEVKISFSFVAGILPTMRVVFENRIYAIVNVNDVEERHREIRLITKTGVSAI